MKIVIAPDSFKGSMSSIEVIKICHVVLQQEFADASFVLLPIADGGEGTIDALTFDDTSSIIQKHVHNPLGILIESYYGVRGNTAIIEMANCSGLTLLDHDDRDPLVTSSHGLGEMIKYVLDDGFENIVIGIGGSATNDGGTGALQALGVKYYDSNQNLIEKMNGSKLSSIERIDSSGLDVRLHNCHVKVLCDVNNPLTGINGATHIYGLQKGATDDSLKVLESGMIHYESLLEKEFYTGICKVEGTGAAGGMGAALIAYLNGQLVSGIDTVLNLLNFEQQIENADFIITGEGRIDEQSTKGKVIHGITKRAGNIPVIAIAGSVDGNLEEVYKMGVKSIFTLPNKPMELKYAMENGPYLLEKVIYNLAQIIKIGKKIK